MQRSKRVVDAPSGRFASPPVNARALTLMENIVALALLSVAMAITASQMYSGLVGSTEASLRGKAALLAQEKMEQVFLQRNDLDAWQAQAKAESTFDEASGQYLFNDDKLAGFRWTWLVSDVPGQPGLRDVLVSISWQRPFSKGGWSPCELRTLIAVPSAGLAAGKEAQQ